MKKCKICSQEKELSAFGKQGKYIKPWCKRCTLDYKKGIYQNTQRATFDIPPIDGEIWRDAVGYEGSYMVSNMGRVKALERKSITGNDMQEKLLKARLSWLGYLIALLYKEGMRKGNSVHRLVAKAFLPNPLGFKEVNHKDGNKSNNRLDNLEWVTRSQNLKHAYATGLRKSRKGIKWKKKEANV